MTVNDNRPDANPGSADSLTHPQRGYVEGARALADAGDEGRSALADLTGCGSEDPAVVYAAGFGAARVLLHELLAIVDELAGRVRDDDEGDGREPYCLACGEWIAHFTGLDGWRHYRGDPSPGGVRQLYAADHDAVPAECVPPGMVLSPAGLATVRQALADAAAWRTWRTGGDHDSDVAQAAEYEGLLRRLVTGEEAQR